MPGQSRELPILVGLAVAEIGAAAGIFRVGDIERVGLLFLALAVSNVILLLYGSTSKSWPWAGFGFLGTAFVMAIAWRDWSPQYQTLVVVGWVLSSLIGIVVWWGVPSPKPPRPVGWLPGTIIGATIMSVSMAVGWSPVSAAIKRLDPEVQGSLMSILGTAVMGIFISLIVWERQIREEWEPAVGGVLGCLLVLLVALIVASLQP